MAGRPPATITDREKAAIYFHLYGHENDWKKLYLISRPGPMPKTTQDILYLGDLASKWKNNPRIKEFLKEETDRQTWQRMKEEERIREKAKEEKRQEDNESTDNKRPAATVDYYDPKNQRTQINKIIQESSDDPRTQLDAIKAIQQTQRDDKQAAKDQQIQRFYSPVRCNICPIRQDYEKRQARKTTK